METKNTTVVRSGRSFPTTLWDLKDLLAHAELAEEGILERYSLLLKERVSNDHRRVDVPTFVGGTSHGFAREANRCVIFWRKNTPQMSIMLNCMSSNRINRSRKNGRTPYARLSIIYTQKRINLAFGTLFKIGLLFLGLDVSHSFHLPSRDQNEWMWIRTGWSDSHNFSASCFCTSVFQIWINIFWQGWASSQSEPIHDWTFPNGPYTFVSI